MALYRWCSGLAAAFAAIATTPAGAQVADPKRPLTQSPAAPGGQVRPTGQHPGSATAIEQIIVTANKRRERQREVANSVTAITGGTLDRRQEVSIQDLASQVPGLSVEVDDKSAVRIVLRGLNTGSAGATVASVLDDVPTNATGAQNNASINSPNFDTFDLNRIEVLRGPQGTLYGATAEGGIIKYVTNAPDFTKYAGELEGGIDGTTVGGIGGSLKGFANFPLLDGKAALRITAWNEWIPGYISNPERGKSDDNSGQRYGWRASFLVDPTPDLTMRFTAERQTLLSNNTDLLQVQGRSLSQTPSSSAQLKLVDGLTNNSFLPQPSQNESAVYYANIDYNLGAATLTSITSYTFSTFRSLLDASNILAAPATTYATLFGAGIYGVPSLVGERQNSNFDKFSQEVRLTSNPDFTLAGHRFDWLVGGFYTHETSALLQSLDGRDAGQPDRLLTPSAGGITLFGQLSEWAVFANADYFLLPTVDLALGGRLSGNAQHSQQSDTCCELYGPAHELPILRSNDHDQLFSIAPRWHVTDDTLFYGRVASGYRPGGPNLSVPGVIGIPQSYGPDRTVNYEVGWRQDLFDKSVAIDLTGFYITWKNVQVISEIDTSAGPFGVNGNAGSAVSKGFEWNLTWAPLQGLKLNATGSYQDARLTKDALGLGGASGDYLPYVPNVNSSVNVDYGWSLTDRFRAYVSGTWSYVGERYTGFTPNTILSVSHAMLPSYNTAAIRAGVEDDRYSMELYLDNIGDSRAIAFYGSNGGADFTGQATIIQPRTIGAVARVKF